MIKTKATRKRKEVRREKMRRVRVAALMVCGEGPLRSPGELLEGGEVSFSDCFVRERRVELKLGSAIMKIRYPIGV